MKVELTEEAGAIDEVAENSLDKLTATRETAGDALAAAGDFVRRNPWVAVAGAAVLSGLIIAVGKSRNPVVSKMDRVRNFIDDTYSRLPSQKAVEKGFSKLFKKLHLPA